MVVALAIIGCATTDPRHWAATTLTCEERHVTVTAKEHRVWEATGCGGTAVCTLPPVVGAEPQCYRAGRLDTQSIQRVIDEHADEARYCYQRERIASPSLAGTVAVKFVIAPSGSVRSSEVTQPIAQSPALGECVASQVRNWVFPKPDGNGSLIVTHPFVFSPSDKPLEMVCDGVSSEEQSRRGWLDQKLIQRVLREHLDEFRYCGQRELEISPELSGTVVVKFIISPTGAVCASAIEKSTVPNAAVDLCLVARLRKLTFPAPKGGGLVMFTHTFTLGARPRASEYETWSPHAPEPLVPDFGHSRVQQEVGRSHGR